MYVCIYVYMHMYNQKITIINQDNDYKVHYIANVVENGCQTEAHIATSKRFHEKVPPMYSVYICVYVCIHVICNAHTRRAKVKAGALLRRRKLEDCYLLMKFIQSVVDVCISVYL